MRRRRVSTYRHQPAMASRSQRRHGSSSSSGSSGGSAHSSGSRDSASSGKSTSSRETHSYRVYRISEIRETTAQEKQEKGNATLYVCRFDGDEQFVKSIGEISVYGMDFGETIRDRESPTDTWHSFNTIAYFTKNGKQYQVVRRT